MPETIKLKYVDCRSRMFVNLKYHSGNVTLPGKKDSDNIINVTEEERKCLLGMKNGNKPSFEEVKPDIASKSVTKRLAIQLKAEKEG